MKNLFLTFGTPAIGKSTFISKNNLQDYTIELDELRSILGVKSRYLSEDNNIYTIPTTENDDQVWRLAYQIAENKMRKGQTVIIDATFLFPDAFAKPRELAHKYNYRIEIIDFMQDTVLKNNFTESNKPEFVSFLKKRDQNRNQNIPEYVFQRYVDRYFNTKSANNGKLITPSEFERKYLTPITPIDLNNFNRIKVIGDIHGDYGSLLKPFEDHKRNDAYIFVGDYLDRGSKNAETFKFLSKLKGKNIFFLKGNHEKHLIDFINGERVRGRDFKQVTLPELLRNDITKKDIAKFTDQLKEYLYFTFDNQTFMVSHAGIEPSRLHDFEHTNSAETSITFADEEEFVNGLTVRSQTPYETDVDSRQKESNEKTIQIHGHRNAFDHNTQVSQNMYNLTGSFNHDTFRYLLIEKED